jgi:hypothetical protein
MGQTIAEALREEGKRKGILRAKQQTLVMLLQRKFGRMVPAAAVAAIKRTKDVATLDTWLCNLVDANRVKDVGISGKR